ncbi:hypothetical protein ACXZ1M_20360 [Duganella sp. PWIR1]
MECRGITRGIATTDGKGRRIVYVEQEWAAVHRCPACDEARAAAESARRLDAAKEAKAAAPLSRWNLAGAGVVVALMGVYACLLLR